MHRPAIILVILASTPATARAEFIMQPAAPPIVLTAPDRAVEQARLARANWLRTHRSPTSPASAAPARSGIADGFGKGVPLRVALLQILPPPVTVRFGEGVDAEQAVDWSGGKPWQAVVRDVVQPLHLRATVSAGTVRIDPAQD